MLENPGVTVQVIPHYAYWYDTPFDYGQARLEIATQLMAGSAPTLINSHLVDPFDPRQEVFFYDWYQLMDADPDFNEDDWFMNAFHAFSINNRLYHFPMHFNYSPIISSNSVPGLQEAMASMSGGITLPELMQIHSGFSENHPHYLERNFNSEWIIPYSIDRFVDVEAGWVDFKEEFIELITHADSITCPDLRERGWGPGLSWMDLSLEELYSERYLFHSLGMFQYHYFIDIDGIHPFSVMTPVVNDRGELLIDVYDNYLLNANATPIQKAIAWDFIIFTMQPENLPIGNQNPHLFSQLQPPNRKLLDFMVREAMRQYFGGNRQGRYEYPWFPGTVDDAADYMLQRMTTFGEMPMRSTSRLPRVIIEVIEENMGLYYDGLLSAEQTAQILQNQITLVLMEMYR